MKTISRISFGLILGLISVLTISTSCNKMTKIKTLPYPDTRKESVEDNYHGTIVQDPYRWLEDDNSAETAAWVTAENVVTNDYLSQIPYRDQIKKRLTELMDYPKEGAPYKNGDYFYTMKNDGLQNQSVLYRQKTIDGDSEIFLDPNKLSTDGTVALASISFSEDGKYFAYAVSVSGSDWVEIKVMDTESKKELVDHIKWVKFSGAVWAADSKGFYYSCYDAPAKGSMLSGKNEFQKVYYHTLGNDQSKDRLVFSDTKHPLRYFHAGESKDGKYIFISSSEGTSGTEILYRETAKANQPFKVLFAGFKHNYSVIYCKNDRAYIYTNEGAPNYRLASVNLKDAKPTMKDIIPESEHNLDDASVAGKYIMASYLKNATSSVNQYDMEGKLVRTVALPDIGSVGGMGAKEEDTELYYSLTSFTSPSTIYKYTLDSGVSELLRKPQVNFDPELYKTEQVFYPSKDGTQVSMFVVHRKDLKMNGKNPLYLYGYGGFNISLTPGFNPNSIMFMEQGGVYVFVNLRGGGEYGEKWHEGGMLDKKQNVFDDFIGAAEFLIEKGYTSSDKIAIAGGSNGGLLVGACMMQRPDLFAVALPAVGVMDMLRFHQFTIGWGWVVEYGSADVAEQFDYLYKYSPLHNIVQGTCYPATMITTADHDDRVVPAHSFKFAAALQAAQGCDNPVLIRIETNAGHGAGKPTSKRIDEAADMYSFIFWNTNSKVKF